LGVSADAAAIKTLSFIENHLAAWRDDLERPTTDQERQLNSQLCKFLNVAARQSEFAMIHFHHEEPQGVRHTADLSATPIDAGCIVGRQYTKYEPVLVLEGKRLPTPGSGREREYVAAPSGEKPYGGVQRFKLGLHGATLSIAGIVGYVQSRVCTDWFFEVNRWIDDLSSTGDPLWSSGDQLFEFIFDSGSRVSRCKSEHLRIGGTSPTIHLTHLWVEMEVSV
jgi:hypothetical protein